METFELLFSCLKASQSTHCPGSSLTSHRGRGHSASQYSIVFDFPSGLHGLFVGCSRVLYLTVL